MKSVLHIAAPVATLLGVLLSVIGTYLVTEWYHPFERTGFWKSVAKVLWLLITGRKNAATRIIQLASDLSMKTETMAVSLFGLYIIFIGFLMQAVGALLWCVDSIVDVYLRR